MTYPGKNRVMIVDSMDKCELEGVKHLTKENLKGTIYFLYIDSTNTYHSSLFRRRGSFS